MCSFKKFILVVMVLFVSLFADEKVPTLRQVLDTSGLKIDYNKIDSGEIVTFAREDQERTDTSIALSMGLYVKAPYDEVLKTLRKSENSLSPYAGAMLVKIKDTKNINLYFKKVAFSSDEMDEVEKLFNYEDDDTFNLSEKEIQKLHFLTKNAKHNDIKVASSFFRELLTQRFQAYLDNGIDGIFAYEHSDRDSTVTKGMKKSSLGLSVLKKWFATMYKDYLNYPKILSHNYKQSFYFIKDKMDDRVVFILKHQMVQEKKNIILIAERQFYISNSLDAIQTQILCIPYKDGTFVALSSQSFTNKVSGFARGMAVKVGRHMMANQIRPIFEVLEQKF